MNFSIEDSIRHPISLVYPTYRDKLTSLVPYLPDVKTIEILERERKGKRLRLLNKWTAKREVPGLIRRIVDLHEVIWLDHAEWDDDGMLVRWKFEIPSLNEYVRAEGKNEFFEDGESTRLVLSGDFIIDAGRHPKVPRLIARTIQPQVEKFIFALIKPNLLAVNRGLDKLLSEKALGGGSHRPAKKK